MKRIRNIFCFLFFMLIAPNHFFGQALNVDSLKKEYNLPNDNIASFNILHDTIFYFFDNDIYKAERVLPYLKYYTNKVDSYFAKALYYQVYGYYKNYISQMDSSIFFLEKSITYFNKSKDLEGGNVDLKLEILYNALAIIYDEIGMYKLSIVNHLQGIAIAEEFEKQHPKEVDNLEFLASAYNDMAQTYSNIDDSVNAELFFNKSIDFALKNGLEFQKGSNGFNYAVYLLDVGDFNRALPLFEEFKKITGNNDTYNLIIINLNEAKIYRLQHEFFKAIDLAKKTKKMAEERGFLQFKTNALRVLSNCYQDMNKIDSALYYALEYEKMSQILHNPSFQKDAEFHLVELYEKQFDYEKAFLHQKNYIRISDSLSNSEISEKIDNIKLKFRLEEQITKNKLLIVSAQVKDMKIKSQKANNLFLSLGFLLVLIVMFVMWKFYIKTKNHNSQLGELNAELIQKKESLNEYNLIQNNLFAIISHDLKGPIGTAKSFFEILNDESINITEEDRNNYIQTIGRSISSTYDLLENILFWSKNKLSNTDLDKEKTFPYMAVNEIIINIDNTILTKGIIFHNNINKEVQVLFYPMIFNVIFRNLLTNAVKFTPRNGEIFIDMEEKEEEYIFSVRDTGIGMSEQRVESLFQNNNIDGSAGTENEKGTGLGLIISYELAVKEGGNLWVESVLDEGSTFFFTIKK